MLAEMSAFFAFGINHQDLSATLAKLRGEGRVVWLAAVIGIAVALLAGQITLVRFSEARLHEYGTDILQHASEVANVSADIFQIAAESSAPPCSDADLNELRYHLYHQEYLIDIGRVENGRLVCTAGWGRFGKPLALPAVQRHQSSGYDLWANIESPMDRRLVVDMASRGSVVVFTSPTAFKTYEKPRIGFAALVLTADAGHIYRTFGDTAGLTERLTKGAPAFETGPRLTMSDCVRKPDICVVASLSDVSIFRQPISVWLGIAALGGISFGGIAFVGLLRRHAYSSAPYQLKQALADDRLHVVYQPLVRIRDERVIGAEVLARITDERGGTVPPDIFISIAEQSGLIGSITRIVIHKALNEMHDWLTGQEEFYISINLAASDVIDPALLDYLNAETARLGIMHQRVILEITERSTSDHDRLLKGVEAFRRNGYCIYIDDFGTGYSSLAYLAKLPIGGIKVDRIFTQAIGKEAVGSTIVEQVCAIAASLNVALVAEGIEEKEQAAHILALHPDAIGQGWLYGRPVSAEKFGDTPIAAA